MSILEILGIFLIFLGLLFFFGTVIAIHRFPDCYTRMHGASKGDTLSTLLFALGLICLSVNHLDTATVILSAKLLFIVIFLFVASPAASHALASAAFTRGVDPWTKQKDE